MKSQLRSKLIREINAFIKANPEINQLEVLVTDVCGHFFGKRYPIDKLLSFAKEGLALPSSMFLLNTLGEPLDGLYYGIDDGDPDGHFYLVPGSLCRNDWGNKPRAQVLATTCSGAEPAFFEPRQVLQKVVEDFAARKWRPMVAFELEFYLFEVQRDANGLLQIVRNPKTGRMDTATVLSNTRIGDFEVVIDDILQSCDILCRYLFDIVSGPKHPFLCFCLYGFFKRRGLYGIVAAEIYRCDFDLLPLVKSINYPALL